MLNGNLNTNIRMIQKIIIILEEKKNVNGEKLNTSHSEWGLN